MNIRTIRQFPRTDSNGLAIGFGIPGGGDEQIAALLPNWGIAVTAESPLGVTIQDLIKFRQAVKAPAGQALALFAFGDGVRTVQGLIVSRLVHPWGVALLGRAPGEGFGAWDTVAGTPGGLAVVSQGPDGQPLAQALGHLEALAKGPDAAWRAHGPAGEGWTRL